MEKQKWTSWNLKWKRFLSTTRVLLVLTNFPCSYQSKANWSCWTSYPLLTYGSNSEEIFATALHLDHREVHNWFYDGGRWCPVSAKFQLCSSGREGFWLVGVVLYTRTRGVLPGWEILFDSSPFLNKQGLTLVQVPMLQWRPAISPRDIGALCSKESFFVVGRRARHKYSMRSRTL